MSSPTPRLSPETRRLISILNALTTDPILDHLISLAAGDQFSFDAPISVMLDGHLIRGRIAKAEAFATALDERLKEIAQTAQLHLGSTAGPNSEAETRRVLVESLSAVFSQSLRDARNRERRARKLIERFWPIPDPHDAASSSSSEESEDAEALFPTPTIDDLSDAEALLALETLSPRITLTLNQAELFVPPGRWDPIGAVRLSVKHIAGWWMPPT